MGKLTIKAKRQQRLKQWQAKVTKINNLKKNRKIGTLTTKSFTGFNFTPCNQSNPIWEIGSEDVDMGKEETQSRKRKMTEKSEEKPDPWYARYFGQETWLEWNCKEKYRR